MRGLFQVLHMEKSVHSNATLCGVQSVSDDRVTGDRSAVTCARCCKKLQAARS